MTTLRSFYSFISLIDNLRIHILKTKKIAKTTCPTVIDYYLTQPLPITKLFIQRIDMNRSGDFGCLINNFIQHMINHNIYSDNHELVFGIFNDSVKKTQNYLEFLYEILYEFIHVKEYEKAEDVLMLCHNIHRYKQAEDNFDKHRIEILQSIFPYLYENNKQFFNKKIREVKSDLSKDKHILLYLEIIKIYTAISKEKQAEKYYLKIFSGLKHESDGRKNLILSLHLHFGKYYSDSNRLKKALMEYKKAMRLEAELMNTNSIKVYNCLAIVYKKLEKVDKAKKFW